MSTPNYKLPDNAGATAGHVRELYQKVVYEFQKKVATSSLNMNGFPVTGLPDLSNDFTTVGILGDPEGTYAVSKRFIRQNFATLVDNNAKLDKTGGTLTGNLSLSNGSKITGLSLPTNSTEATSKAYVDAQDALKANSTDVTNALATKLDLSGGTLTGDLVLKGVPTQNLHAATKSYVDSVISGVPQPDLTPYLLKSGGSMTGSLTLSAAPTTDLQAATKKYVDDGLIGRKATGTFDSKIQHSSANSALDCSGANQVDIKVNGSNRGYFYQPVGQTTTPLGLYSNDKLQLQSALSSSSVYGSKPLSSDGSLNTHALYVGGLDDASKNVQSMVQCYQGTATASLSASHTNYLGAMQNTATLAGDSSLLIGSGTPYLADPCLVCYSSAKATSLGTNLPLQASGKMGYDKTTAITEANQFPSKTYVDTADASKLSLSGGTMTGSLTLAADPTQPLQASTKQYVDVKVSSIPTPDLSAYLRKDGSVPMTGELNMNGFRVRDAAAPGLPADLTTKSYVDGADLALQGQITNLSSTKISQTDADARYLRLTGGTMSGAIAMGSQKISGLGTGTLGSDAVNLTQMNTAISTGVSGLLSQTTADGRYVLQTTPLNSITTPNGNLAMGNFKITGLGTPTTGTDACTKAYADSLVTGGGSSGSSITSADGTKKVVANNGSVDFQENGSTHLSIRAGSETTTLANYDLVSSNSSAVSNQLQFYSSGVANQTRFFTTLFTDGSTQKTRIGGRKTGLSDVYLDCDLTNQQLVVPATAKFIRTDTTISNFSAQEYITRAYADSRIGSSMSRPDSSIAILKDGGVFVVSPNGDAEIITNIYGTEYRGFLSLQTSFDPSTGMARIAGSSYPFGVGLQLHPDQSDFTKNRLVIGNSQTMAYGSLRYDPAVLYNNAYDLVPRTWVESQLATKANTTASISSFGAATGNVSMGNNRLSNLAEPVDGSDAATRAYVLNALQALGVSSYPANYTLVINMGDVPSSQESWYSTGDKDFTSIVSGVTWTSMNSTQGYFTVNLNGAGPFATGKYEVLTTWRSNRTSTPPSGADNDIYPASIANKTSTSFRILTEEQFSGTQDVSLVCLIVPSAF